MKNLEVNATDDGTWLTFKASDGKSATIHLETMVDKSAHGPLVREAILQWCEDQRHTGAVRLNDHPIIPALEGQWEKIAMIIMHAQGLKEFKLTPEVIRKWADAYAPGMPCMITEGLGPTGNEIISLRVVTEAEALRGSKVEDRPRRSRRRNLLRDAGSVRERSRFRDRR